MILININNIINDREMIWNLNNLSKLLTKSLLQTVNNMQ